MELAVVVDRVGPYDGLAESWNAVTAYVEEEALETRAAPWEEYLDDLQETLPQEQRTRIVRPIR